MFYKRYAILGWVTSLFAAQALVTLLAIAFESEVSNIALLLVILILQLITAAVVSSRMHQLRTHQLMEDEFPELLSPEWMASMLSHECKRAIREFAPLTVMQVIPDQIIDRGQQGVLAEVVRRQLLRSGDMICAEPIGDLKILLPATNEAVKGLAQRCLEEIETSSQVRFEIRMVVCTFQPRSDLSSSKVVATMSRLREQVLAEVSGTLLCEVEGFDDDELPGPTYLT